MMRLLTCLFLAMAALGAGEVAWESDETEEDIQSKFMAERAEKAASYRLARARFLKEARPAYHAAAAEGLERARQALVEGSLLAARDQALAVLDDHPYAEVAPHLVHIVMRTYAIGGDIDNTRLQILDLWERFPGYEGIGVAMEELLLVAETIRRDLGMAIDLEADRFADVVKVSDNYLAGKGPLKLFYFLRRNGDRHTIAPRASLGIARCHLALGTFDRAQLFEARFAYDRFLVAWPDHPLVFRALMEQAISYLLAYRGPKYDVGVLISAAGIIDQAEIYTEERQDRIDLVADYRARIRLSFQERDLFQAGWYRDKGYPERARYYYGEVVRRDPGSAIANEARTAMAALPPPPDAQPLGPVVAPPDEPAEAPAGGEG